MIVYSGGTCRAGLADRGEGQEKKGQILYNTCTYIAPAFNFLTFVLKNPVQMSVLAPKAKIPSGTQLSVTLGFRSFFHHERQTFHFKKK